MFKCEAVGEEREVCMQQDEENKLM